MPARNTKRILILDDELSITLTLSAILEMHGHTVRTAHNHNEALSAAAELQPEVLITGFKNGSPENGCETAASIVDRHPACRVLVLTACPAALDSVCEYQDRGYDLEFWIKPVSTSDLLGFVDSRPEVFAKLCLCGKHRAKTFL